ncbi:MAG: DUF1850 domain-containing protein [Bacillaceae bacterium]|nr:DUF1850 domain-containing protein [Bacillaceae bacterium]
MIRRRLSTGHGAQSYKIILTVFLLLMVLTSFLLWLLSHYVYLEVKLHDTGVVVYKKILKVDETITLDYIHSVTEQPVYEIFYVRDVHTLALREMRYDSFGANLPVGLEQMDGERTEFIVEDGYYKIDYIPDRSFDSVPLRVGQVIANHKLVFEDGTVVRFLDHVDGGSYIEFYVRPMIPWL